MLFLLGSPINLIMSMPWKMYREDLSELVLILTEILATPHVLILLISQPLLIATNTSFLLFFLHCFHKRYDIDPCLLPEINTRHLDDYRFRIPFARTNSFKFSVFNYFPHLWNSLPADIRDQAINSINYKKVMHLFLLE